MFQYYMAGREPTKQALLALGISLGMTSDKIDNLLHMYGYCLSKSLPNDAVASWFLQNSILHEYGYDPLFLDSINETLAKMELPVLMTKPLKR